MQALESFSRMVTSGPYVAAAFAVFLVHLTCTARGKGTLAGGLAFSFAGLFLAAGHYIAARHTTLAVVRKHGPMDAMMWVEYEFHEIYPAAIITGMAFLSFLIAVTIHLLKRSQAAGGESQAGQHQG